VTVEAPALAGYGPQLGRFAAWRARRAAARRARVQQLVTSAAQAVATAPAFQLTRRAVALLLGVGFVAGVVLALGVSGALQER
jgi:hypothetical protein